MRINIPRNPEKLIQLARRISAKHTADGPASALAALPMSELEAKTNTADTENQSAAQHTRAAETAFQYRDLALGMDGSTPGTVTQLVRSARDMLMAIYKGREKQLGDWGFEVDTSTQSTAPTPPSPPAPQS